MLNHLELNTRKVTRAILTAASVVLLMYATRFMPSLDFSNHQEQLKRLIAELPDKSNLEGRFYALEYSAKTAMKAGDIRKASEFATEWLVLSDKFRDSWNYGNALHDANVVLGRVAIVQGNVAEAKKRLLLAGDTPGSPQLNSFGPDMSLAHELAKIGERETVLAYLAKCERFWDASITIGLWRFEFQLGLTPGFGHHVK